MKIIAIPSDNNMVDAHFGHCQYYTIYTVGDDDKIEKKQILPAPAGCGCKSDIASILAGMGVKILLAGNMGEGAVNKLKEAGLIVYRGYAGLTEDVVKAYLDGDHGSDIMCEGNHGDEGSGHSCSHH